jgi:hypothetical protein
MVQLNDARHAGAESTSRADGEQGHVMIPRSGKSTVGTPKQNAGELFEGADRDFARVDV